MWLTALAKAKRFCLLQYLTNGREATLPVLRWSEAMSCLETKGDALRGNQDAASDLRRVFFAGVGG
jgi:hypothetical protein